MARYDEAQFGATHNSYSGGARGPIATQLSSRIRCIELDFHDNGYAQYRDYRIGHMVPGHEVDHHGNPSGHLLYDWLAAVADWCKANAGHGPITIILDSKDDLTDNEEGGDLRDFNRLLERAFGPRLFTREEYGAGPWPEVRTFQNRVLCVLSGNQGSRVAYRWTRGRSPALAANASGDAVLAYQSTAGDLRCWAGLIEASSGRVSWTRRGTYEWNDKPLGSPAVALTDDRWVIAVHGLAVTTGFPAPRVVSRVGRLGPEGHIVWFGSAFPYGLGSTPTVQVVGDELRSIYVAEDGVRHMSCGGSLNRQRRRVEWRKPRPTDASLPPRDTVRWQSHALSASVAAAGVIETALDGARAEPVRLAQLAFMEQQKGDDPLLQAEALFLGADAKQRELLAAARGSGLVVRAWGFAPGDETTPPANMPATDAPGLARYAAYLASPGVVA